MDALPADRVVDLQIVLVAPEIPQNTGNIGRLCVCTGARLHLVRPLGFCLDEAHLRRAGLDYWRHVDLSVHDDWEAFVAAASPDRLHFFTTRAERSLFAVRFQTGDCLVFGRESTGLPGDLLARYPQDHCRIPMPGQFRRSLNLANSVAIGYYEAWRQLTAVG